MRSTEPGFVRKLEIPQGVTITHIFPELPDNVDASRSFLLYPGGTVPRFGVQLMNRRNVERIVRVEFDASRFKEPVIAGLLRGAGLDVLEKLRLE